MVPELSEMLYEEEKSLQPAYVVENEDKGRHDNYLQVPRGLP